MNQSKNLVHRVIGYVDLLPEESVQWAPTGTSIGILGLFEIFSSSIARLCCIYPKFSHHVYTASTRQNIQMSQPQKDEFSSHFY